MNDLKTLQILKIYRILQVMLRSALWKHVSMALYTAKATGRNWVRCWDERGRIQGITEEE